MLSPELYRVAPTRPLLERALAVGVTAVDTAFNYDRFAGHRVPQRAAGTLLGDFSVATRGRAGGGPAR
ncbi:hypothetical protein C1I97_01320 [Streptomyces sp. NTH33]|uniref:hypothetical protein n=1 Tax=Streptomyces sp. NTH33 TaxID=1735453 RepID=UPI000DA77CC9|nr:hypothetical protein [Streptomyces sp. NTH33]PZH20315.1 hypothetical protein C1I97_01320 [Streptomyces sp. NTH33]